MFPQNLISWSKVPVCSLKTLVLLDLYEQYKDQFGTLLKKKYGDITAGLIACGDDYPLEATIARRCLRLISRIDAPFSAAPELPARSYRNRVAQAGGDFWPPGSEPSLKLYPKFRRVIYKTVKEESRIFGYNTLWAMLPPIECLDEAFLELMRTALNITRRG